MTDEERKQLCRWLRDPSVYDIGDKCAMAADEIERLATKIEKLEQELELVRRDEERFLYD